METLPNFAKIAQANLGIVYADDAQRSAMDLRIRGGAKAREVWAGSIAFAPLSRADASELLAWLSLMDGRQLAFGIPMAADFLSVSSTRTGTLSATANPGAASISLSVSPATGTIKAGTLLTLGDPDTDAYQVIEVLADATVSAGAATVEIGPRIRKAFASASTVTFGATSLRVRLVSDSLEHAFNVSHGIVSVEVIEAAYA